MGELRKKVGKRIREIRESLNIKQFELADMLDMEPSNLTRIESGYQFPKEENISKIASKLGVEEKDLFDFAHIKTKQELIELINILLNDLNEKEMEYFYKSLVNLRQMR